MKVDLLIGPRGTCDSRVTLLRVESAGYLYGDGWKFSVSLAPRFFFWQRWANEFRLTILGVNLHWRSR